MQKFADAGRNRLVYGVATAVVIIIGLASRRYPALFPASLGKYPGDALWALLVFFGLGFLFPKASIRNLAICSLGFSYLDEFSQLYHASWIDGIRSTAIGHLVLGYSFSWVDILAYTIGVSCGVLFELIVGWGTMNLKREKAA